MTKLGRRKLFITGAATMIVATVSLAVLFLNHAGENDPWQWSDTDARDHLKQLESMGYLAEEAEGLSERDRQIIQVIKTQLHSVKDIVPRYRIEKTADGYYVHVMWVHRSENGYLVIPPPGAGHMGVQLNEDLAVVKTLPGA